MYIHPSLPQSAGARPPARVRDHKAGSLPAANFYLAIAVAALLSACGGGGGSTASNPPPPAPPVPSTIQVSGASALSPTCGLAVANQAALPAEVPAFNSAVQPQLAANLSNPQQLYGVYEQDRWDAIGTRAINFASSSNGGVTWSGITPLPFSACGGPGAGAAYDRASDPSIAVGQSGTIYASALAFSAGGFLAAGGTSAVLVTRSTDGGATWQTPTVAISDPGTVAGPNYFNDRDAIAADPNGPDVYLLWDQISNVSGASMPTYLAHSGDGGAHWSAAKIIYQPGPLTQTFNNQPLVLPNGDVVDIFTVINGFFGQLTAIRSTDHGANWLPSPGVLIAPITTVGTINPTNSAIPIRDSANMAQTAVDPVSGTLAAVWQDSSPSGGLRDGIVLSLSHDEGATWSAPAQVNAVPTVAAFNPMVHFGSNGRIAVTYYDFRDYVSGSTTLSTGLWLRESADGGKTWTEKRLYGPFDLNSAARADLTAGSTGNALFLGDQQGLAWTGVAWTALFAATNAQGPRVFAGVLPP
jgi:hypothetical protein